LVSEDNNFQVTHPRCVEYGKIYIHVTVLLYRFLFNNQPDALIIQICSVIKLYIFWATSLPIIRSVCIFGTGKFHAGFWWRLPSRFRMELPAVPS